MNKSIIFLLILLLSVIFGCTKEDGKIAFTSSRDGNEEIYVMNDDGTNQMKLTNNPGLDWYPKWSPDGKKIIFGSSRNPNDENDEDIYIMDADGRNVEKLTNSRGWSDFGAWSPDGSRIAFCSDGDDAQHDLYIMNADGSGVTRLTSDTELDYYPSWSPDGMQIVYMRVDTLLEGETCEPCGPYMGNCEIYVINIDGTNKINISNNPSIDGYPSWSPDGASIAFNRAFYRGEKEVSNICIMNPDGTNFTQLTKQTTIHEPLGGGVPRWSPDGSRIVFQSENEEGINDIYIIEVDGTNKVNLTNNADADWYAAFSPKRYRNK